MPGRLARARQRIVPASGRRMPARVSSRLDLPAPLGPRTSNTSPAPTLKIEPSNQRRPPRLSARPETVSSRGSFGRSRRHGRHAYVAVSAHWQAPTGFDYKAR